MSVKCDYDLVPMHGHRKLILSLVVAIAAVATFGLAIRGSGDSSAEGGPSRSASSFDPDAYESGAKKLAEQAIEERDSVRPEVGCPEAVAGVKGTMFTCEALVRGDLVPVTFEVFSNVGDFVRVVDVGRSADEVAEYRWCGTHGDLEGRAACSEAYESR